MYKSASINRTWKRINDVSDTNTTSIYKDMRYFIYYPPANSIRLIDVSESVLVEDILVLIKKEFGLNIQDSGPAETSIVLSYNGSDLKPTWSLADLSIPSGAIIRCLYREQKAADLYIHCSFNKQILKLFDSSITIETTINSIRKIISNKLGIPLSVFCLETLDNKQRLYDQMKLINYDIKIHDHIYLKVWRGYEKFINSCIKGFTEPYSHDDLTKHYQTQVALYIAAFYGHMELANSVMQLGARSDRPVGEHPSRQWSSETSSKSSPEMLKCPIHIAVERGHVKMVNLFVRQSILCTQIRDPITGYLPFETADICAMNSKTKEEKQLYRVIYYYLYDKQCNLKIPLNANGDYVTNLLTSNVNTNTIHLLSPTLVFVSLPLYCKIINWYERAREKAWKKFGGRFYNPTQTKRVYAKKGLLGYKVLIDGYNNTFEVPIEQIRNIRSSGTSKSDLSQRYYGFTEEERDKIIKMKSFVKDFVLDDRKRAKQIAANNLQQSRRPPIFLSQTSVDQNKRSIQIPDSISSSTELSTSLKRSHTTAAPDIKTFQTMLEIDNSSVTNLSPSTLISAPSTNKRIENNQKIKRLSKTAYKSLGTMNEQDKPSLPIIATPLSNYTSITNKLETVINVNKRDSQHAMSSVDAYTLSTSLINIENQKLKADKKRELLTEIQQSVDKQMKDQTEKIINPMSISFPSEHKSVGIETYIPLPDRPSLQRSSPIKSRLDYDIRQSAVKPYERYASATTRSTAVHCLQEAGYFKGKSWLKQVELSKEMVKHHVKRRIRRADNETNHKPILLPLHRSEKVN